MLLGALPMANVLAVGILIGQRRPGSRPFLLGFEAFGAMALALFVALASFACPREVVIPYLAPLLAPMEKIIGPDRPFVLHPDRMLRRCGHARLAASGLRPDWWLSLP